MKVYNSITLDMSTGETLHEDSYEYSGEVALAKGGSSSPATTTQVSEPWAEQKPYLERGFQEAESLYEAGMPEFYQGKTIADPAWATTYGLQEAQKHALNPMQGSMQSAQGLLGKTMEGGYLDNPYLDQTMGYAMDRARTPIDQQFEAGGRYGSGLHKTALGREFAGITGDIMADQYGKERDRMLQAAQLAPGMDQAQQGLEQSRFQQLLNVGQTREAMEQEKLNQARAEYDYNAMLPQRNLANYLGAIQGNYGGTTTGTSYAPQQGGGFSGAGTLGGALGGAGLASTLSLSNPWTAGLAIGGGLLGGFF